MTDEEFMQLMQAGQQQPEEGMLLGADAPQPGETVARAREFAEKSGPTGTALRSAMSSATAGLANPLVDVLGDVPVIKAINELLGVDTFPEFTTSQKLQILKEQERLQETQQDSMLPKASTVGSVLGAMTPGGVSALTGRGITKALVSSPAVRQAGARVLGDVALGGLQAGLEDESVLGGAVGGAVGGAIGESVVPFVAPAAKRYGEKIKETIGAKTGLNKTTSKLLTEIDKLLGKKTQLEQNLIGAESRGARKIGVAERDDLIEAQKAKEQVKKAEKDLAKLKSKIERGKFKEGTPEAIQLDEAKKAVSAAQGALKTKENALDTLVRQAEVAGGKAQQAQIKETQKTIAGIEAGAVPEAAAETAASKTLAKQEEALQKLTQRAEIAAGKKTEASREAVQKEINRTKARLEEQGTQEQLIGVLRRLVEESDESAKAYRKQLGAAKRSEEELAAFKKKQAEQTSEQAAAEPEAAPSLADFRYGREQIDQERELLEDAYATGQSLRALGDQLGIPFQTLQKRIKNKYGITRESAKEASEKRAAERAAKQVQAEAAPEVAPELIPRPAKPGLFEAYPTTEADIRTVMKEEAGAPIKRQALEQQLASQQKALGEVTPVGVESTQYAQALESQKQLVEQAQQALEQASQATKQAAAERLAQEQAKLADLQEPGIFDVEAGAFGQAIGTQRDLVDQARQALAQAQERVTQAQQAFDAAPSPGAQLELDVAEDALEAAKETLQSVTARQAQGGRAAFERQMLARETEPMRRGIELTDKQVKEKLAEYERQGKITEAQMTRWQRILASADQEAKAMVRNLVYEKMQQEEPLTNQ